MSYHFLLEREPSDKELKALTDAAIIAVKEKKTQALDSFMNQLKQDLINLKKIQHAQQS
ncbi:hypothetical protein JX580_11415 [Thiomicrospira microaerophila]|uniref:hypothetical protein n=1 Tax=Thiomicrospira microaerophila TaxID=406020 RepID=UPI00200FDCF3|nr:hypothetical protein [Thiomicrospira microaerophila]UQB42245.1 hypothetical protein JX580_11415 [Thiomicrospira microaerophila]